MAFRGRGRGRGYGGGGRGYGGGGGFGFAKQEPVDLFPDIELPDKNGVTEEKTLVVWNSKLQNFWKSSPYYIEGTDTKKSQSTDIERFSDRAKPRTKFKHNNMGDFVKLTRDNFPVELLQGLDKVQGSRRVPGAQKKVRWNPESDMQKLDLFEKLEQKYQDQDEKGGNEKEGKNEDEDEEEGMEEADEEFSDDGDYNQNIDFDDDEDDFNMEDDNDDEPIY